MKYPNTTLPSGSGRRKHRATALLASVALAATALVAIGAGTATAATKAAAANSTADAPRIQPAPPPLAYVADGGSNTVKVVDAASGVITTSIPVGSRPFEVTVTPNANEVWVADNGAAEVSVIDTLSQTVRANIPVGAGPAAVAFTPNGATAYVSNASAGTISVVNASTDTVTATISLGGDPRDSQVTPDGSTLYVADHTQRIVYAISTATNTVTARITPSGTFPVGLAITPDGASVYVANNGTANVSVIATATNTVTATIPVGDHPSAVALSPNGSTAYVPNNGAGTVSVINTATGTVTATIPVGAGAVNAAVSENGSTAFVTNLSGNSLSLIDTATNTVTATIAGFSSPRGVAATHVLVPEVTAVDPSHGPLAGGNTVTIAGTSFNEASAVDFGSTPATSSTVTSDTSIIATVPAGSGVVDVTVTTPGGISLTSSADKYSYDAADLSVTVSAAPASTIVSQAPAAAGSYTAFTVTVTNNGPTLAATNTVLNFSLGSPGNSANLLNALPSQGSCVVAAASCGLATIPVGGSATVLVLAEPQAPGAIGLTATASSSQPDPNLANNTAGTAAPVTNANNCNPIGTPGADNFVFAGQVNACGLGGNDVYTGVIGAGKYFLGSGIDRVNTVTTIGLTVFGGYGADLITLGPGGGLTGPNLVYAGDYLYPGARPDTIRASGGTVCFITPADMQTGCSAVIIRP